MEASNERVKEGDLASRKVGEKVVGSFRDSRLDRKGVFVSGIKWDGFFVFSWRREQETRMVYL